MIGDFAVPVKSLTHVWFLVTPWTVARQAPPSLRFPRQEYWSGLPFPSPGAFPTQGSNLCLQKQAFLNNILLNQKLPLLGNQEFVGPALPSLGPRTVLFDKHEKKVENHQTLTVVCNGQWFSKCGLWTTSPGNLLEMQIFGPHTKFTESEILRVGPHHLYLYKPWEPLA